MRRVHHGCRAARRQSCLCMQEEEPQSANAEGDSGFDFCIEADIMCRFPLGSRRIMIQCTGQDVGKIFCSSQAAGNMLVPHPTAPAKAGKRRRILQPCRTAPSQGSSTSTPQSRDDAKSRARLPVCPSRVHGSINRSACSWALMAEQVIRCS